MTVAQRGHVRAGAHAEAPGRPSDPDGAVYRPTQDPCGGKVGSSVCTAQGRVFESAHGGGIKLAVRQGLRANAGVLDLVCNFALCWLLRALGNFVIPAVSEAMKLLLIDATRPLVNQ